MGRERTNCRRQVVNRPPNESIDPTPVEFHHINAQGLAVQSVLKDRAVVTEI
jgi:hypothetical protein